MKSRSSFLLASLLLWLGISTAHAGVTGVTQLDVTVSTGDTINITVQFEGATSSADSLVLRMSGQDIYGNEIVDPADPTLGFPVASASVPDLDGPGPDTNAETGESTLRYTIPNDGTLYNLSSSGYTFTPYYNGASLDSSSVKVDVALDIEAVGATYIEGTYEGGDLFEVSFTVSNTTDDDTVIRPLRPTIDDDFRINVGLTPDPGYDKSADFLLGFVDVAGDAGSFIPTGTTEVRKTVVTSTPPLIDTLGRNYQPQPDDFFLDIGETLTITQEFLIPKNFSGTYFLAIEVDSLEELTEVIDTDEDNIFVSNRTPRVRIITGPASNTLPVSEVTDTSGNQVAQADGLSDQPSISGDATLVAFQSFASNLTPDETSLVYNGLSQVFLRYTSDNSNALLSKSVTGGVGNGSSLNASMSENGRYVAFESDSSNLVNNDTNGFSDIFVRDLELSSTSRISINANSGQANGASFNPSISADGRFVAFESVASNLDLSSTVQPGPGTGRVQIYVADRDVSGSGSFDLPGNTAVYLVSFNNSGDLADRNVLDPVLSLDADAIAFVTDASNFPGSNNFDQVYMRVLNDGQITGNVAIISRASGTGAVGNGDSSEPAMNGGAGETNGLQVAFSSQASNLVANDTNGVSDIFVRDFSNTSSPETIRVSVSNIRKAFASIQFEDFIATPGVPPANNPTAGDTITFNDGVNPAVTFTFGVDVALGANAAETRDNLVNAINAAPNLLIFAYASNPPISPYGGGVTYGYSPGISLLNEQAGTQGNQPILTSITPPAFISDVYGGFVSGGTQASNLLTPIEQGVPTGSLQPSIDRIGAIIAYRSLSQNLSINPETGEWLRPLVNGYSNVFLFNRDVSNSGTFDTDGNTDNFKISVDKFGYPTNALIGTPSSGSSRMPSVSGDGGTIAFSSDAENNGGLRFGATNVIPLDDNGFRDVFIYQLDINRNPGTGTTLRPSVTVSSPSSGDKINIGSRTILEALVSPVNPANPLTVEFYVNGLLIARDSQSPYVANWTPDATGDFAIVARAIEENVGSAVSGQVLVNVATPSGAFVEITDPIEGNAFALGNAITITVDAGVVNTTGTVDSVVIAQNGVTIATLTSAPYTTTFTPSSNGQIILSATATASVNGGSANSTASDSVSIVVATNPPTVTFTSPQNGDDLTLNAPVDISATASSANADVASVEFFADGVSIGMDTSFPYAVSYTPTTVGELVLQAFVTDSEGIRSGGAITVDVLDISSTVSITSPAAGSIFSIYDPQDLIANVNLGGRSVRDVEFFANGVSIGSSTFSPFQVIYDPDTSGDVVLTARVTFKDGVKITSAGVPVQVSSNPRLTTDDFIAQTLTDLFAITPTDEEVQEFSPDVDNTTASKVSFITTLTNSADFQSGVSIMGSYLTQLYRYPTVTEYQTAISGLGFAGSSGSTNGSTNQIAIPSQTLSSLDSVGEQDVYSFTLTSDQDVSIFTEGPTDTVGTLRNSAGNILEINDQSGDGNNFLINTFLSAGTYTITVTGFFGDTGIYTLYVQGTGSSGSGGTTGSSNFDLEGFVSSIYQSDEYLDKFGQIPDLTGGTNGSAGDLNRRYMFRQLWAGKYGGTPNDQQQLQASLRMVLLGGLNPFTAIFISEQQIVIEDLSTGQASDPQNLIIDAGTRRGFWRLAVLVLTLWNEQPTNDLLKPLQNLSLSAQIEAIITDERYLSRFPAPESLLFNAEIQSDGWMYSPWMQGWVNGNTAPWYLHTHLGWIYTDAVTAGPAWFYSQSVADWLWTSDNAFPWVYFVSKDGGGWYYGFYDDSSGFYWYVAADGSSSFAFATP